jgi:hypothetical protein
MAVAASSDAAVGSLEGRSSRRRGTIRLAAAAQVAESIGGLVMATNGSERRVKVRMQWTRRLRA